MKYTEKDSFGNYRTYEEKDLNDCLPSTFKGLIGHLFISWCIGMIAVGIIFGILKLIGIIFPS